MSIGPISNTRAPCSRLNWWFCSLRNVLGHIGRMTRESRIEGVRSHCSTSVMARICTSIEDWSRLSTTSTTKENGEFDTDGDGFGWTRVSSSSAAWTHWRTFCGCVGRRRTASSRSKARARHLVRISDCRNRKNRW